VLPYRQVEGATPPVEVFTQLHQGVLENLVAVFVEMIVGKPVGAFERERDDRTMVGADLDAPDGGIDAAQPGGLPR
jgi:hypothetical protein